MVSILSRRSFLQSASTAALVVGFSPRGALAVAPADGGHFNPFVKIDADGRVTAIVKHFEMGQGTSTGLPTLIAEELGVDLDDVAVEFAPSDAARYANLLFGSQATGGSTSMANSYLQYRQAGAAAREMLLAAAAEGWNADPSTLALSKGMIAGAGRSAPMKVPERPRLKDPGTFTLIGNPQTLRRDNGPKIDGSARFAMDVQLENQLVAVVRRSPRFGGTVVSVDASAAAGVPGFVNAAILPSNAGVVVYARDTWAAFQARDAVVVEWNFANAESRSSAEIRSTLLDAVRVPPRFVVREGPGMDGAGARLDHAAQTVEGEFFLPWLCHAPMEPLTCTIEPTANGITLHDGCQSPSSAHQALAAVLGLPMKSIRINTLYAGGSFGRRATTTSDYIVEAAQAFAMTDRTRPVKLVWSREDDLAGGAYRPAVAHRVRVGLDGNGDIVAWDHRIAGKPIFKGSSLEQWLVRNGVDHSSVEGVPDTLYRIPGMFVGLTDFESPITVSWWRSVGHSHTAFVMESMMDMAARAAGCDPVTWRLDHLRGGSTDQRRLALPMPHKQLQCNECASLFHVCSCSPIMSSCPMHHSTRVA